MRPMGLNNAVIFRFQPLQQLVPLLGGEGVQEDQHGHVHAGLRVAAQGIPGPRFEVAASDRLQATRSGGSSFRLPIFLLIVFFFSRAIPGPFLIYFHLF